MSVFHAHLLALAFASAPAAGAPSPGELPAQVQVRPLAKVRHNLYTGFRIFGGVTNYDELRLEPAFGIGAAFRMGGRLVDAFALGGEVHAAFSARSRAGAIGAVLLEGSVFPLKKLGYRGLAIHLGIGALSYTRRLPQGASGTDCTLNPTDPDCLTTTDGATHAGGAMMAAVGWDFWLQKSFNFGVHARIDGGYVPRSTDRSILLFPALQLAFSWY